MMRRALSHLWSERTPPKRSLLRPILSLIRRQARDEDGGGTLACIFLLTACLALGGAAIDIANGLRVREILQANAEAAALSAAVRASEPVIGDSPRRVAQRIALEGLREARVDDAWHNESFELGTLDAQTREFTPTSGSGERADAVRVTLNRADRYGNAEPLLFSHLFGYAPWNIMGRAVAQIRSGPALECEDPLLSLQTRVDISTKNAFVGICLYANATVDYGEKPLWSTPATDFVLSKLIEEGLGLPRLELFGMSHRLRQSDITHLAESATQNIQLSDLDNISVLSGGSVYVSCEDHEVLRLGEGFVLENVAVFSECPIRFDGEVRLRASLVVSNLTSLVRDLDGLKVTPDAILTGSRDCAPGGGLQVLLFADLDAVVGIPALVSTDSPLGEFPDRTVAETGGVLSDTIGRIGGILNPLVRDLSEITRDLQLLPICLNATTMLQSDTVVLR